MLRRRIEKSGFLTRKWASLKDPHMLLAWIRKRDGIKVLTGAPRRKVDEVYKDLRSNLHFSSYMENALKLVGLGLRFPDEYWQFELYVICRLLRPRVVVETGVEHGISTCFILRSLDDNQFGRLYSIDLPPPNIESGWLVPKSLRHRWELHIGKSADLLPSLLKEIGFVDLFLHDSEHTYTNMMFEFTTVWPYIVHRGLIIADDASWNNAFSDFCRRVQHRPIMTPHGKRALKKIVHVQQYGDM